MNLQGYPLLWMSIFLAALASTIAIERYGSWISSQDDEHENQPRLLGGLFSRPKPQAEKQHGLKDHLGNILQGGTIGFQGEIQPMAPIQGIINHAKDFLSKPGIIIGFHKPNPTYNKPDGGEQTNPWWQGGEEGGKGEYGEKEYPDEKPGEYEEAYPDYKPKPDEYEEPKDWETKEPNGGKPDGPKWEDIGEESYDDKEASTTVPIEHIINPRKRTKRRAESKVFHVPLEFLSNAKPYLVKIGLTNSV